MHCDVTIKLSRLYVKDHFIQKIDGRQIDGRQIAKNRHIATPTTNQMRNLQGMIHV